MHIAIIGTRGIPNNYGGFEQFAQYLSVGLVRKGFQVTVYNSHNHPYQKSEWNGVQIVHCNNPEDKLSSAGQFIYDFNCIMDTRKKNYDIILQLGYTSSSIWGKFLPRHKSIITTNMDGFEWKRTKFSRPVRAFLKFAEKLAVWNSDYLIADSIGMQQYLIKKYNKNPVYIPYGAEVFDAPNVEDVTTTGLEPYNYDMLVARLEPENSIEVILDGVVKSASTRPFLVVGKYTNEYGQYLMKKFKDWTSIKFMGGIYDISKLNNLRYYSNVYFHGHTVGGTNPSLLEAMASHALVSANDNIFNRSILGDDAYYFNSSTDVATQIEKLSKLKADDKIENNTTKIAHQYSWPTIIDQYVEHFYYIARDSGKTLVPNLT
jgi:glycosyltransferase involved in cell wall biosynthesis